MEFYLFDDGKQVGQYTEHQVRNLWNAGSVTSRALYWTEGQSKWLPLVNLCEPDDRSDAKRNSTESTQLVQASGEEAGHERKLGDLFSVFTRFYARTNGSHARSTLDPGKIEIFLKKDELILRYQTGLLFKSKHTVSLKKTLREAGLLPEDFSKECWRQYIAKNSGGGNFLSSTLIATVTYATTKTGGIAGLYLHFVDNDGKLLQAVLIGGNALVNEIISNLVNSGSVAPSSSS